MAYSKRCIVTGAAGFIGSALVRLLLKETEATVLVVDKLTYAGVPESLKEVGLDPADLSSSNPRLAFLRADICDQEAMDRAFADFRPDTIFHLAAESHVDRSIDGPGAFIRTNVVGTATLLQSALKYWRTLPDASTPTPTPSTCTSKQSFVFQHISTDEVYGTLGETGFFTEQTPYSPHSPYSASKASSDHLVRAWHDTYGLPVKITNCSNNYGPYHFPEKLIPLVILNCLEQKPLPVYGKGANVRDWLYVEDHARALLLVNEKGGVGETYNVGGHNERTNLEVVKTICRMMDDVRAQELRGPHHLRPGPPRTRSPLRHRPRQADERPRLEASGKFRNRNPQDRTVVPRQRLVVASDPRKEIRRPKTRNRRLSLFTHFLLH